MCRIAGIYSVGSSTIRHDVLMMRDSMHRGGPDDEGIYIDEDLPLGFGHRRLSLIDLSAAGHQPMSDRDGSLQLIFNGEIYNYLELKALLVSLGHSFRTRTDTEVIIKAYIQWGFQCFEKFNGMFSLAMWDKQKGQLVLARDHAGIKPLYYSIDRDKLVFASEIRAFKAYKSDWPEDLQWQIPFLTFGHLPEPFTTLKNVYPLAKGTYAVVQLPSLQITHHTFASFQFTSTITDLHTAVSAVKEKLEQSVKRHLISDAPIGLFLSGGVDSSLLTLIAHKYIGNNLKTLSIIFDDATLNEEPYQKLIIDKSNAHHQAFLVTEKDFTDGLPDILNAMDQPSIDGINSYFICKYARQYGLTAVLSGLGADELFGGYNSFRHASLAGFVTKLPDFLPAIANVFPKDKIKRISFLKRKDHVGEYLFNRGLYTIAQTAAILSIGEKEVHEALNNVSIVQLDKNTDNRNRASHVETNLYMQNQLLKDTDYMSMWHSLEVRVPFLDKELMEVAFSIAPSIKYDKKTGKHLLIKAFDDLLPKEIWQRKKQGFTFPFYKWMKNIQLTDRDEKYRKIRYNFNRGTIHWSKYWTYLLKNKNAINCFSANAPEVLFINLNSFSVTGGIEKFNRSFLKALSDIEAEGKIIADGYSMYDKSVDEKYFNKNNYLAFAGKRIKFIAGVVRNAQYYDLIIVGHLNLSIPSLLARLMSKNKRFFLVIHGLEVAAPLKGIKKAFLTKADKVLAVSNFTKSLLMDKQQINQNKINVFHNTLDPYFNFPELFTKPDYLKKRYQLNGQKIIYTLTRLSSKEQYKGYDKVLNILPELRKKHPGIKYLIAGKADDTEKLRVTNLIEKLGLQDNVQLLGFLKNEEVIDHYLLADVFIMPSTMEGFGIVFIEAMACGLPVIAGNVDGSVDALRNGQLGKLINPSNESELFNSFSMFDDAQTLSGKNLQDNVQQYFGFPEFKNKLEAIILR